MKPWACCRALTYCEAAFCEALEPKSPPNKDPRPLIAAPRKPMGLGPFHHQKLRVIDQIERLSRWPQNREVVFVLFRDIQTGVEKRERGALVGKGWKLAARERIAAHRDVAKIEACALGRNRAECADHIQKGRPCGA